MLNITKFIAASTLAAFVSGCTLDSMQKGEPVDLGDFRLGHNVVVTKNATIVDPSAEVSAADLQAILENAVEQHFGGYSGTKLYHLGVHVDSYSLALQPQQEGVAPEPSRMVVSLTVWDDAAGDKLNASPVQITLFETPLGDASMGFTTVRSVDAQMADLGRQLADQIELYLIENRDWFGVPDEPVVQNQIADIAQQAIDATAEPVEETTLSN